MITADWMIIAGSVNTALVIFSVYGVYLQLRQVYRRKAEKKRQSTELLSLNQFTVSFFAYFSFFIFGFSLEPMNHFMVWPRLVACLIVYLLLIEILKDRNSHKEKSVIGVVSMCFVLGLIAMIEDVFGASSSQILSDFLVEYFPYLSSQSIATVLILIVSASLAQGYTHQIYLIIKHGKTGAVSLATQYSILVMDFSTIWFAITIGIEDSWPMMVLATVSGLSKLVIIYLFRWVRVSETAYFRRKCQA